MDKKRLAPRVPPLSPETLANILAVEKTTREQLAACHYYDTFNVDTAIEILRTSIVTILNLRLNEYIARPDYKPEWMNEIKTITFDTLIKNTEEFPNQYETTRMKTAVLFALNDHAAARAEEQDTKPTAKANQRQAIYESYLADFPDEKVKILDICWAVGQHYREWKRWIKNEWKEGSKADLAFRKILTSGKLPLEFNKKPRPPKWQ